MTFCLLPLGVTALQQANRELARIFAARIRVEVERIKTLPDYEPPVAYPRNSNYEKTCSPFRF